MVGRHLVWKTSCKIWFSIFLTCNHGWERMESTDTLSDGQTFHFVRLIFVATHQDFIYDVHLETLMYEILAFWRKTTSDARPSSDKYCNLMVVMVMMAVAMMMVMPMMVMVKMIVMVIKGAGIILLSPDTYCNIKWFTIFSIFSLSHFWSMRFLSYF